MLSPSGRSRMWDAAADGYARGEATGALVLKRLCDAIEDGDHIECVIRETGINQDGRTKGITMPSETSQAACIRDTYQRAGLDLNNREDRCQYFEAHGTGTAVGDPKEAEAIAAAFFGPGNTALGDDILFVGSIKTVVGHTEGTAGIAAVIKASLSLQHAVIPPNLHFNRLNPAIEPFYKHLRVPIAATPWPTVPQGQPRRVSVNSFGKYSNISDSRSKANDTSRCWWNKCPCNSRKLQTANFEQHSVLLYATYLIVIASQRKSRTSLRQTWSPISST